MMSNSNLPFGTFTPPSIVRGLLWLAHRTFIGRGKFRDYTYPIIKLFHDKPVDMHFWGAPIRIDPRTNPLEREPMLRYMRVDRRERALMRHYLEEPGSVLVDLGANMGLYTFDAVLNGSASTRVIAVEANPAMADRLGFNVETMHSAGSIKSNSITLFPVAVGATAGTAQMNVSGPEHTASLFGAENLPLTSTIEVQVQPLLDILLGANVEKIDFLKIDVEGYEGEALGPFLQGAPNDLLPRCIQIEHNAHEEWSVDVFGLLREHGYAEFHRIGMNAFWSRPENKPYKRVLDRIQAM